MRIVENYVDHGFGFPVVIDRVRLGRLGGEIVPIINYAALEKALIRAVPDKPARLTGDEVRFIRLHFQMSLKEFGERFQVSHVAVRKWENAKGKPAGMRWSVEKDVRLFVLNRLKRKPSDFVHLYEKLGKRRPVGREPIHIPSRIAAASTRAFA